MNDNENENDGACASLVYVTRCIDALAPGAAVFYVNEDGWMKGCLVPLSTGAALNAAGMHAAQACRSALLPWSTPVCISSVDDKRIACISIQ